MTFKDYIESENKLVNFNFDIIIDENDYNDILRYYDYINDLINTVNNCNCEEK